MTKKIIHYSIENIDKEDSIINLIWGERSNGKSYQVKHKKGVEYYLESGKRFILMRRWKEEVTTEKIEQYFADVDVNKLTDGKYNCITVYRKVLYFSKYNFETNKISRGEKIGYVVALSTEQNYAGASYLDVDNIIFEEFMSRSVYLPNEADKLMNFYSTVDRKRGTTKLWLVGNTISRVCPYINDWDLHTIITNQKQGTIVNKMLDTGTFDDDGKKIEIKLSIEYCKSTGRSSFAIGKHKNMLNNGAWQTDPQPHLPKSKKEYVTLYKIGFQYQSFKFIAEYLFDNKDRCTCWFIYPYYREFKDKIIIFSDVIKPSRYYQKDIYNPLINNDRIKKLLSTFKESNIFYSTDMCGTDFKQVIDFMIKK